MRFINFNINENDHGRRIDKILRKMLPKATLSIIYRSIRKGMITLNSKKIGPDTIVQTKDILQVSESLALEFKKENPIKIQPALQTDSLKPLILFENSHILALNKPQGILVHGTDSLDSLVKHYLKKISNSSLSFTPGPVHRLDRNTSGLILFAASLYGSQKVSEMLKARCIKKYYLALFDGIIKETTTWKSHLKRDGIRKITYISKTKGKEAFTKVIPLISNRKSTLALCIIFTGRTHQIRAQGVDYGHPLMGDKKYNRKKEPYPYILHAAGIYLINPPDALGCNSLYAPLPAKSYNFLCNLFGKRKIQKAVCEVKNILTPHT